MASNVFVERLCEPLNDAKTARFYIDAGDGNLMVDQLISGEPVLADGSLQYMENQSVPVSNLIMTDGEATLTLKGGPAKRPWLRLPWSTCNGATDWQVHLNPGVSSDITAHSNGGNVRLNLAGIELTRLFTDTGGGNMDVVLPDSAANLNVTAKTGGGNVSVEIGSATIGKGLLNAGSGAGNVVVRIPRGLAARIHATTGLGKVEMDPKFNCIEKDTYESSDYITAEDKVEISALSGAGNVVVSTY